MGGALTRVGTLVLAAAVVSACGSSSKSGGAVAAGNTPFTVKGGKGTSAGGGNGGSFQVQSHGGAEVRVDSSGAVNTAVTLPTQLPYLGTNWQDVTANTTLDVGATGFSLAAGSTTVSNATGVVTGIRVRPGATLTIKPNFDTDNADGDFNFATGTREEARLFLSDGLIVEGTIKIAVRDATVAGDGLGTNTADFYLYGLGGLYVAASGTIDVSGADNASGAGANGGFFQARPEVVNNLGTITTKGGAGATSGGNGGYLYVYATRGYAVSTGSLVSDGGSASAGPGGGAGWQDFESSWGYGYVVAKGLFSAAGGNGTSGGGRGNGIYFYSDRGGIVADGTFRSAGGDATVSGDGGVGGYFEIYAYGALRAAGAIDAHGGKGAGTGAGGNGGYVDVEAYENSPWGGGAYEPDSASIYFGASVDTHGGDGATGGNAGYFYMYNDGHSTAALQGSPIRLVGYPKVDLSGGDGATFGGSAGGSNYLESWYGYDDNWIYRGGSVYNTASFTMRGGAGGSLQGGNGSGIFMQTTGGIYPPYDYGVTNLGALDGTGGKGATSGGSGGYFSLYGTFFLTSSGAITASGGDGGTGQGGWPGEIDLYSSASLQSSGALTANGGSSASGNGSPGGSVYAAAANAASLPGAVSANGGNSTSATGGNGGYVWIMSQETVSSYGSVTTSKGTGAAGTPANGQIWIDGMQIAGP